jgi:uncharacterized RDD family membrane protein YckC
MKCQGCGHEYPSTFPRCSRCGELSPKRTLRSTQSRLLEFPRKTRVEVERESNETALPQWRKELNEKVRAVKARKIAAGPEPQPVVVETAEPEIAQPDTVGRRTESHARPPRPPAGAAKAEAATQTLAGPRTSNAIVEAALTRVRRATENASRASLSRIEPARPAHQNSTPSMVIDKQATARALEITEEINLGPSVEMAPLPTGLQNRSQATLQVGASRVRETRPLPVPSEEPVRTEKYQPALPPVEKTVAAKPETVAPKIETAVPQTETVTRQAEPLPQKVAEPTVNDLEPIADEVPITITPIDEIEPLDYLQAEIRKIDRQREEKEFAHNESPSLAVHAVIGLIDLLTVAVSAAPFLAVIQIMDGQLGDSRTQLAGVLIVLLVSFFYLAVTQCLSGKTLGMMMTNTRIVDVHTFEPPSGQRLLLRTIGYFIAIAPATLGLLWFVVDRYRRGWQDVISGTRVVRDF